MQQVILKKSIRVHGQILPVGTKLTFGNEGYADYGKIRVHKSLLPEAAVEHVSQKRKYRTLCKTIQLGDTRIPKGTKLAFGAEGYAMYNGIAINIKQIPAIALEADGSTDYNQVVKLKMPVSVRGTLIPAGEALMFNSEGNAMFGNESISIYDFPTAAIEMDEQHAGAHNAVHTDKNYKKFEDIEPGDLGTNEQGETIRFLGKAVGRKGYDALVNQFGDASGKTFEEITNGMTDEEINAANFVCYTIPDGTVCVNIYDPDYAVAVEQDGEYIDFAEVASGDPAIDKDGNACTIVAKGEGTVWYGKMLEALKLECQMESIKERTGLTDDELGNMNYVVIVDNKNNKSIDIYGQNGVRVVKK